MSTPPEPATAQVAPSFAPQKPELPARQPMEQLQVDDTPGASLARVVSASGPGEGLTTGHEAEDESHYPHGLRLYSTMAVLIICLIVGGLDVGIVAVAVPSVSNQFKSIADIGWYSTVLRVVWCSFMFMFGKIYTVFPVKSVFLISLAIFTIGNAVTTFAVSSAVFIVGRGIAGFGFGGLTAGCWTIFTLSVPLRKRALYGGVGGGIETIAATGAPVLGGALIDAFGWRACFGMLVPLTGMTVLAGFFLLPSVAAEYDAENQKLPLREKLRRMDLLGTAIFVPSIACLLVALQWGGTTYGWGDVRIVVLLVAFVVLLGAFGWRQKCAGEQATLPIRILKMRSILAGACFAACCNAALAVVEYYLSIYFQGVRGWTPTRAGLMSLPMVIGLAVSGVLSGSLTTVMGYYYPLLFATCLLAPIPAGLLTTLDLETDLAKLLCYQTFLGFAIGLAIQVPQVAAQTVLPAKEVPIGIAIVMFGQQIGPVLFVAASANLFKNRLRVEVSQSAPGTNLTSLTHMGLSDIRSQIGNDRLMQVLSGYDKAVVETLYLPVALTCLTIFAAVFMDRVSVKREQRRDENGNSQHSG